MRIALATVGTAGDIVPFVALTRGLLAAAHEVTAVSWELYRHPFEAVGARFVAAGPATSRADIAKTATRASAAGSPMAQVAVLRDFHLRDAAAHYRALRDALADHDLVLLHGIHTLAEAAVRDAGLRYATAVFDPVLLPTASAPPAGMPSLGPLNRLAWRTLDSMLRRQDGPLHEALRATGSAEAGRLTMFRARSPLLHLVGVSPLIAPPPPDLSAATHFTGAWIRGDAPDPLPASLESFLSAGDPPVVVSYGSMVAPDQAALLTSVLAGIASAGQRTVLQDGSSAGVDADGVMHIGELDHRALLPRAVAVVHHGGAGTTHAAVGAGMPSVVVPHVGDQPFWAARLHRLGVAPAPLPIQKVSAEAVRRSVQAAIAGPMRSAARALGDRVAVERGVANAVGLLEHAVG